jgi:hypothetical protein
MYCELSMMIVFILMIYYILYDLGDDLWCPWSALCLCSGMICYMLMFCYDMLYAHVLYDLGVYDAYDLWVSWISCQAAMAATVGVSSDRHADVSYPSKLVDTLATSGWCQRTIATVWTSSDGRRDVSRPSLLVHIVAMARWHQSPVADVTKPVTGSPYSSDRWCHARRYSRCTVATG